MTGERQRAHQKVRHYTIGAVMAAVASLEGMVNEFLDNALSLPGTIRERPSNITDDVIRKLAAINRKKDLRTNALENMNVVLSRAGLAAIEPGSGVGQQVSALIDLRNELVHHVPVAHPHGRSVGQNDLSPIQRTLRGKFKPSTMADPDSSFIWQRCLSADCARWAVLTAEAAENAWSAAIGSNVRSELRLDEVNATPP
ncbi:MAG TPA: hypothetical protein VE907_14880 [Gammaproteobacteria bacterium]|nr:hypothetical protein [Gammaproteobacteria bacterium]